MHLILSNEVLHLGLKPFTSMVGHGGYICILIHGKGTKSAQHWYHVLLPYRIEPCAIPLTLSVWYGMSNMDWYDLIWYTKQCTECKHPNLHSHKWVRERQAYTSKMDYIYSIHSKWSWSKESLLTIHQMLLLLNTEPIENRLMDSRRLSQQWNVLPVGHGYSDDNLENSHNR